MADVFGKKMLTDHHLRRGLSTSFPRMTIIRNIFQTTSLQTDNIDGKRSIKNCELKLEILGWCFKMMAGISQTTIRLCENSTFKGHKNVKYFFASIFPMTEIMSSNDP